MKILAYMQNAAFISLLICSSGDSYINLLGVVLSLSLLVLTTLKLKNHGV